MIEGRQEGRKEGHQEGIPGWRVLCLLNEPLRYGGTDDTPTGWQDVSAPCAEDAITLLFSELNELRAGIRAGLYPAPWPPSVDLDDSRTVFHAGRLLNGKFSA